MSQLEIDWPDILTPDGILLRRQVEALDDSWRVIQITKSPLAQQGFIDWRNWFSKVAIKTLFIDPELKFEIERWRRRYNEARAEVTRLGEKTYAPTESELNKLMFGESWAMWMIVGAISAIIAYTFLSKNKAAITKQYQQRSEQLKSRYKQLKSRYIGDYSRSVRHRRSSRS